jgi:hypothetical protein
MPWMLCDTSVSRALEVYAREILLQKMIDVTFMYGPSGSDEFAEVLSLSFLVWLLTPSKDKRPCMTMRIWLIISRMWRPGLLPDRIRQ